MEPLQVFVSRLYRAGVDVPAQDFQRWSLEELKQLIPHDVAVWGMGNARRSKFHNVKVIGAPADFATALQGSVAQNPIYPLLGRELGKPVDMADVWPDSRFYGSDLYRKCFQPYGVERILSSGHADERSGLYSLLSIYRFDRKQRFTEEEKQAYATASYHLIASFRHAFFLHLARPKSINSERAAALVDAEGVLREVQPEFLDLLERAFSNYTGMNLPFELRPELGNYSIGGLCVQVEPFAGLYIVRLWIETPLDRLTHRERQVVLAVCRGLSHKEVGRELGLAPTTVSSHLYRAYGKLGVESRSALARMVHKH